MQYELIFGLGIASYFSFYCAILFFFKYVLRMKDEQKKIVEKNYD